MSTRTPIVTRVASTERLTPHMIRIVLEAEELRDFPIGEFTDHYVKLQFPPPGAGYSPPFDPAAIREVLGKEQWHRQRTYTVRDHEPAAGTITIDFVTHGSRHRRTLGRSRQARGPAPADRARWRLLTGPRRGLASDGR